MKLWFANILVTAKEIYCTLSFHKQPSGQQSSLWVWKWLPLMTSWIIDKEKCVCMRVCVRVRVFFFTFCEFLYKRYKSDMNFSFLKRTTRKLLKTTDEETKYSIQNSNTTSSNHLGCFVLILFSILKLLSYSFPEQFGNTELRNL